MKSKRFRMISLVLVLVLALQLVPVASAASISARYDFTEEELEYTGFAIVAKNDGQVSWYDQPVGVRKYHTSGTITTFPAKTYVLDYPTSAAASDFYPALEMAASMIGVNLNFRFSSYSDELSIWSYEDTGYYRLTTNYYGHSGSYDVYVDYYGVEELWDSGFFSMAPYRCDGITGYIIVS